MEQLVTTVYLDLPRHPQDTRQRSDSVLAPDGYRLTGEFREPRYGEVFLTNNGEDVRTASSCTPVHDRRMGGKLRYIVVKYDGTWMRSRAAKQFPGWQAARPGVHVTAPVDPLAINIVNVSGPNGPQPDEEAEMPSTTPINVDRAQLIEVVKTRIDEEQQVLAADAQKQKDAREARIAPLDALLDAADDQLLEKIVDALVQRWGDLSASRVAAEIAAAQERKATGSDPTSPTLKRLQKLLRIYEISTDASIEMQPGDDVYGLI